MIDPEILKFISKQTCLTISCISGDGTWSASCYYAFLEKDMYLIFKSSEETKHIQEALKNPKVSGTILRDKTKVGEIMGIQFEAILLNLEHENLEESKTAYYLKFPYALAVPGKIWTLKIQSIKMTINKLGFGKKLHWTRE